MLRFLFLYAHRTGMGIWLGFLAIYFMTEVGRYVPSSTIGWLDVAAVILLLAATSQFAYQAGREHEQAKLFWRDALAGKTIIVTDDDDKPTGERWKILGYIDNHDHLIMCLSAAEVDPKHKPGDLATTPTKALLEDTVVGTKI